MLEKNVYICVRIFKKKNYETDCKDFHRCSSGAFRC
jgi:hypothetical protein